MSDELGEVEGIFDTHQLHTDLLRYVDDELHLESNELPDIVAFLMQDGHFKFSVSSPLGVIEEILKESRSSDRLMVIVSVAYLDDQIRRLLGIFLAQDKETRRLLNAETGPLPFLAAARLAFSSGLIARESLEILKEMASLRNKFAHQHMAQSFEDLLQHDDDPKEIQKSLNQIFEIHKRLIQKELDGSIHWNFIFVFRTIYSMLQFSIDHIAPKQPIQSLNSDEIIGTNYLMGFTRMNLQRLIDNNLS